MQTNTYTSLKFTNSKSEKIQDHLVIEAPLQININQKPYTVVMRTPGKDVELIRGLLFAEDIYKDTENLQTEITEEKSDFFTIINCIIATDKLRKGYLNKRTLLSVSSCGICGKQELKDIQINDEALINKNSISVIEVPKMFKQMMRFQKTFQLSGGSHAAAIFNKNNQLISINEDIGRHNALDKCIGELLNKQQLKQANCLLVSGRVSYEIVSKAFFAKITIIVAVSAVSSLAVDFAKEFGICLIGFSRGDKMTVYANPQYLKM